MAYRPISRRSKAVRLEDDYWIDAPTTMEVIISTDETQDTGLVDQFGVTIYRVTKRERMGF